MFTMSEQQISLRQLEQMIALQKRRRNITIYQFEFLLKWFEINKDKKFGFQGTRDIEEQLNLAIEFLQHIQKEWQDRTRDNLTSLSFNKYFLYTALGEGMDLPINFDELIKGEII